jgi:hypothetical protein
VVQFRHAVLGSFRIRNRLPEALVSQRSHRVSQLRRTRELSKVGARPFLMHVSESGLIL